MCVTVIYTHKGWVGICPVYLTDISREGPPNVEARSPWLLPLLDLSKGAFLLLGLFLFFFGFDPENILIIETGELETPVTISYEVEGA